MDNVAVRHVKDLDPAARAWVSSLFGRSVEENEQVTVVLIRPHPAPPEKDRNAGIAKMDQALARMDERTKDVPAAELEDAIDEAMRHVRRWKD